MIEDKKTKIVVFMVLLLSLSMAYLLMYEDIPTDTFLTKIPIGADEVFVPNIRGKDGSSSLPETPELPFGGTDDEEYNDQEMKPPDEPLEGGDEEETEKSQGAKVGQEQDQVVEEMNPPVEEPKETRDDELTESLKQSEEDLEQQKEQALFQKIQIPQGYVVPPWSLTKTSCLETPIAKQRTMFVQSEKHYDGPHDKVRRILPMPSAVSVPPKWSTEEATETLCSGKEATQWMVVLQGGDEEVNMSKITCTTWCIVVIGTKTPNAGPSKPCVTYLDLGQQKQVAIETGMDELMKLPVGHIARKNLGYLYALKHGAQKIWDIDPRSGFDVNSAADAPCSTSLLNQAVLLTTTVSPLYNCDSIDNPLAIFSGSQPPRSGCYFSMDAIIYERIPTNTIGICHHAAVAPSGGDAKPYVTSKVPYKVGYRAMTPFDAQSTLYTRDTLWTMLLPLAGTGKSDDIELVRSLITQRILKETKLQIIVAGSSSSGRITEGGTTAHDSSIGSLIKFLLKWKTKFTSSSVRERFLELCESLIAENLLSIKEVITLRKWLQFLEDNNAEMPLTKEQVKPSSCNADWPEMQLFVPVVPGNMAIFETFLHPSLLFFWPHDRLDLVFVIDNRFEAKDTLKREGVVETLVAYFPDDVERIAVAFNNRFEPRFGSGHDIQQNIMFWGENYTFAEYIGFVDEDAITTASVVKSDLFDENNRPHTQMGWPGPSQFMSVFWRKWAPEKTKWCLGKTEPFRAMNYFPVIVHRSHLAKVREQTLIIQPSFRTFDDLFAQMIIGNHYSQFNIIFTYLWYWLRDEYNWHISFYGGFDPPYYAENDAVNRLKYPDLLFGPPQNHGVTEEQLLPKARIMIHGNDHAIFIPGIFRKKYEQVGPFMKQVLRTGYCYSQQRPDGTTYDLERCFANFSYWMEPTWQNWIFEELCEFELPHLVDRHQEFLRDRCHRSWNIEKVNQLFPEGLPLSGRF